VASIMDSIQQQVTATAVQQVSQRLGVDPAMAQQTVNAAIPVITAAIAARAKSGNADAVHAQATAHASNPKQTEPTSEVLADQHASAAQRVSDITGVSRDDAGKILESVAPAVMRGIGQHVQQQGIDPGQLANVLSGAVSGSRPSSQAEAPAQSSR
jgi:hypothetical protein